MQDSEKKQIARLTLQALANTDFADDCVVTTLTPSQHTPALYSFYNLEPFRRHFRELLLYVKAFEEVCRRQQIEFDANSRKAWHDLQTQRPDLVTAARQLANNPEFVVPLIKEVQTETEHYMLLIGEDTVALAIQTGIEMLVQVSKEAVEDVLGMRIGAKRREAKERRQSLVNVCNRFAQSIDDLFQLKKRDRTKNWRFNYGELCNVVCKLGADGPPLMTAVEQRLKTSNLHRILKSERVQKILKDKHRHTDYKWPTLVREIWDRHCDQT